MIDFRVSNFRGPPTDFSATRICIFSRRTGKGGRGPRGSYLFAIFQKNRGKNRGTGRKAVCFGALPAQSLAPGKHGRRSRQSINSFVELELRTPVNGSSPWTPIFLKRKRGIYAEFVKKKYFPSDTADLTVFISKILIYLFFNVRKPRLKQRTAFRGMSI